MNEQQRKSTDINPIDDIDLAWDMAHAEKPYLEIAKLAGEVGIGHVVEQMASEAKEASGQVYLGSQIGSKEISTQASINEPEVANRTDTINIKYRSFGEAEKAKKRVLGPFIDAALGHNLSVDGQVVGVKGYFDKVETTPKDNEVIDSPERIADLYVTTSEMIARNLKVAVARDIDPEQASARRNIIKNAKNTFLKELKEEIPKAKSGIMDWCSGASRKFPVQALEYHGFSVAGNDLLDASSKGIRGVRPNFKIQRQMGGVFIMAYSDERVLKKLSGQEEELHKRIYLNPDMEATPQLFEQLLQTANEAGISLQLKMYQRAPDVAEAHRAKAKNEGYSLRGDGIVVYVEDKRADDVLGMVLDLAKDNPSAFKGRQTSRIPQMVAEGVSVGDEPLQVSGYSLTSHRAEMIDNAMAKVRETGKKGEEAHRMFRGLYRKSAQANAINPDNLAFNA